MPAGFYKLDVATEGLAYAPNYVHGSGFSLSKDDAVDSPSKTEIINGWRWFEADTDAYAYFGLTPSSQPWTITPLQAKLALHAAGLLDTVEAFIAQADRPTQIAWEYASEFKRNSPMLLAMAGALGMTDTQLDGLFTAASAIKV